MKTNQVLSVAVVALLGITKANIPQQAPVPISHPVNVAPIPQAQAHIKVPESKLPGSDAHV